MKNTKRENKKIIAVIVFALLLVFLVTAGTMAWLTRTSSVTNTFTVGSIEVPTTSPTDPTKPITIDGNIYEPSWDSTKTHKLVPSISFAKDPYVGIGEGSEDSVVYVHVKNNFSNKVYFTINDDTWEKVEGETIAGSKEGTFTSGIFKYKAGLSGATNGDVWTTDPLFNSVETASDATITDFTVQNGESEIVVTSFLHQAKDSEGNAIPDATILAAAKVAFGVETNN